MLYPALRRALLCCALVIANVTHSYVDADVPAVQPTQPDRMSFLPGQIWPDNNGVHINAHGGGFLFHDGRYYWFGEHKNQHNNLAEHGVHVYSSTDLYNWTDEGIALHVSQDPDSDITSGCVIERPKVVYNAATRKFVMWFHLEYKGKGYGPSCAGVAVADRVTGPYTYIRSGRPNAGVLPINLTPLDHALIEVLRKDQYAKVDTEAVHWYFRYFVRGISEGQMSRDMTVFVDDDGAAYHIYSSEENRTLHIARLSDDYTTHSGIYARELPGGANEAPAVIKHKGKYYMLMSGLTGWDPNEARYAVADHILGPWKRIGNPCTGTNPHNKLGANKTFGGQSTYIIPVHGRPDAYIAVFDEWRPKHPIDGRYYFLPLQFDGDKMVIPWMTQWDLSHFDQVKFN